MRVALYTSWDNAWIPYIRDEFDKLGADFVLAKGWNGVSKHDLVIHGWANGMTQPVPGAKNVMFLRRYELFDGFVSKVDWKGVDLLICVNMWISDRVREIFARRGITVPVTVIYNGTDLERWQFKERKHGKMIGMACHVHPKKNLPLALQILGALPEDYELHIAGDVQDHCTAEYLNHVGNVLRRKVYLYGHIPRAHLDLWWEGMNYCLSTSISEGNPNNVIEAMAKGIKPVIHDWPGADEQFPSYLRFGGVDGALRAISGPYESKHYRDLVKARFGLDNYSKLADVCTKLLEKEAA